MKKIYMFVIASCCLFELKAMDSDSLSDSSARVIEDYVQDKTSKQILPKEKVDQRMREAALVLAEEDREQFEQVVNFRDFKAIAAVNAQRAREALTQEFAQAAGRETARLDKLCKDLQRENEMLRAAMQTVHSEEDVNAEEKERTNRAMIAEEVQRATEGLNKKIKVLEKSAKENDIKFARLFGEINNLTTERDNARARVRALEEENAELRQAAMQVAVSAQADIAVQLKQPEADEDPYVAVGNALVRASEQAALEQSKPEQRCVVWSENNSPNKRELKTFENRKLRSLSDLRDSKTESESGPALVAGLFAALGLGYLGGYLGSSAYDAYQDNSSKK